jgi:glycosyltransferase involved in cell wall biosynthesis
MPLGRMLIVLDAYVADAQALSTTLDSLVLQQARLYMVEIVVLVSYRTTFNDMLYVDRLRDIENYRPLKITIDRSADDITQPGRRLRPMQSAAHEFVLYLNQGDKLGPGFIDKACLILETEPSAAWVDPKHGGKLAPGRAVSRGPFTTASSFLIGPRYSSGFVYRRQDLAEAAAAVRWPGRHNLLLDLIVQTRLLGRGRFPIRTPEIECVHGSHFPLSGLTLKPFAALMAVALRSTGLRALLLWWGLTAAQRRVRIDRGHVRRFDPRWLLDSFVSGVFRRFGLGDRFVAADPALIFRLLVSPLRFEQHVLQSKGSLNLADIRSGFVRRPKLPVPQRDEAPLGSGVLFAHTNWTVGGAERVLQTWMASARSAGIEQILEATERENWTSGQPDTSFVLTDSVVRRQFAELGDEQYSLETLTPSPLGRMKLLLELVARARPGLLFISGNSYAYAALPALKARFPGLIVVDILHNEWGSDFDWFNIAAEYDQYIDRRIVISDHWRRVLVEKYRTPFTKILLVENGVPLEAFSPDEAERKRLRLLAKYGEGDRVICFVGRLHEQKRPEVFFELARLFRGSPEYRFVVAGDGPLRAGLLERYADLDNLTYLGATDRVAELLQTADLAVFCSAFEGYPVTSLEAAAMNVAVVAPDIVGFREQIGDGRFGLLYTPTMDATSDAELIGSRMVQHWEDLQALGRNGRDFVNRRHDLEQISRRQQTVLKELLGLKTRHAPSLIRRRPRLFLHVGMPKTGSSSIQWFLNNNRALLQDQGLLYPREQLAGDAHHPIGWLCRPRLRAGIDQVIWLEAVDAHRPVIRAFIRDLAGSPYEGKVLSSEALFSADPRRVSELLEPFDVRTIIYLRRQDSYLEASLNQNTKVAGSYVVQHEHVRRKLQTLDYSRWLSLWEASLGGASVEVIPFERQWFPEGLERGFVERLGLAWDSRFVTSVRNGRMTRDCTEFLVRLNSLGRLDRRSYLQAMQNLQSFADAHPDPPAYRNVYSPRQRREFLELFRDSNAVVARDYVRVEGPLFSADFDDEVWQPYPGLSAEAAAAIAHHLAAAGVDRALLSEVLAALDAHR